MTPVAVVNAHVVTCDDGAPPAEALLVADGRVKAVGTTQAVLRRASGSCRVVDADGRTVVPGLVDAHCHVFGSAAARLGVECGPASARSLDDVLALLRAAAAARPAGEWVRGFGFDDALVAEGRFPTSGELDAAVPANPVELRHSSGHAVVRNALARDPRAPRHDAAAIEVEVARMTREWLGYGTTFLEDVGADNGPAEYAALARLVRAGAIVQRVGVLLGPPWPTAPLDAASGPVPEPGDVRANGIKLALGEATLSSAALSAVEAEIRAHAGARLVAIHVVELGALAALIDLLTGLAAERVDLSRVRLEHVSLCPEDWAELLAGLGVIVVTQPGFLFERGERYRRLVPPEQHGWLYPAGELLAAGVRTAGSSDSPVSSANPYRGMAAAVERRSRSGDRFAGRAPTSRLRCLELYTTGGAAAVARSHDLGRLAVGHRGDFAILDRDPLTVPLDDLPGTAATATFVDGRCVHGEDWVAAVTVA